MGHRRNHRKKEIHQPCKGSIGLDLTDCKTSVLIGKEQLASLDAALERLPERQREAVHLKHIRGMKIAEIAKLMECSHASVAGLLRRGTAEVRQFLGG
jgi:RNA polymerase sigma factor (sigma-70 family)